MPLICPHCQIAQAEDNESCINCGQPLTPVPTAPDAIPADHDNPLAPDPIPAAQARRPTWRLPAAIAAALLLALAASVLFAALRGPGRRPATTAHAVPPPAVPPVLDAGPPRPVSMPPPVSASPQAPEAPSLKTAAAAPSRAVPLSITLDSTRAGRHVKVGEDVTLTALAHGRSETLTLFYRREQGRKTMHTFIEGSLCSTTWTPAVPGRYEFTATALDDRQHSADSRRVDIIVDGPGRPTVPQKEPIPSGQAQALPRVTVAPSPPRPVRRPFRTAPPTTAGSGRPAMAAGAETREKKRLPALTYHVAAAKFPFLRNATVLSDALNRRGYKAVPEPMADSHGKVVYVVVTGAYRRPKEARAAALALQRNGYPAYFFGGR